MTYVLRWIGGVFAAIGAVFLAVGIGLGLFAEAVFLFVFGGIGLTFCLLGIIFLVSVARGRRRRAALLQDGLRIDADLFEVGWDTRCRFNGRCPMVVRCQAVNPQDGRVYVFQSEGIWFDPSPFLAGRSTVPVCVDPDNYHRYAVDLSGILPQQG